MSFMQMVGWFGVRWWIWLYFGISIVLGLGVMIFWQREKIKKVYYELRYAEKIIKIIIHFPSNLYRVYWRLIPDDNQFKVGDQLYAFDDKAIIKDNDFFAIENKGNTILKVDGKTYDFDALAGIKDKKKKHIEMHYFFNNPSPIGFDCDNAKIKLTSTDLEKMKENDLFTKLLTLGENKGLIGLILLMCFGIAGGVAFIIMKLMEMI